MSSGTMVRRAFVNITVIIIIIIIILIIIIVIRAIVINVIAVVAVTRNTRVLACVRGERRGREVLVKFSPRRGDARRCEVETAIPRRRCTRIYAPHAYGGVRIYLP